MLAVTEQLLLPDFVLEHLVRLYDDTMATLVEEPWS